MEALKANAQEKERVLLWYIDGNHDPFFCGLYRSKQTSTLAFLVLRVLLVCPYAQYY